MATAHAQAIPVSIFEDTSLAEPLLRVFRKSAVDWARKDVLGVVGFVGHKVLENPALLAIDALGGLGSLRGKGIKKGMAKLVSRRGIFAHPLVTSTGVLLSAHLVLRLIENAAEEYEDDSEMAANLRKLAQRLGRIRQ